MAGRVKYLIHRNNLYFTRMRVPAELQLVIGKPELLRSQGGDPATAHRKHAETVVEFMRLLDEARGIVQAAGETGEPRGDVEATDEIDDVTTRRTPIMLQTPALRRDVEPRLAAFEYAMQADDTARYAPDMRDAKQHIDFSARTRPAHSHLLRRIVRGLATDAETGAAVGWAIDDLYGDAIQRGSPEWRIAAMSLAAGMLDANSRSVALDAGGDHFVTAPPVAAASVAPAIAVTSSQPPAQGDPLASRILCDESRLTLLDLLPLYQEQRNVSPSTISTCEVRIRAFHEVTGGPIPVYQITRDHMRAMRRLVMTLPTSAGKRFPGMTLAQATAANAKRSKPFPVLNAKTAGSWLGSIKTILEWASRYDFIPDNPGASIIIEKPKRGATKGREQFTADELGRIFNLPSFKQPWREDEWVYAVALYSGMRASEIAQMRLDWITTEQGVLVFNVDGELKNATSKRKVPVHPDLLALGLQRRIDALRATNKTHLFPVWYQQGIRSAQNAARRAKEDGKRVRLNSYWPTSLTRRFNVTIRAKADIPCNKPFHSFRHTFKTGLSVCGVPKDMRDLLTGHADSSAGAAYVHDHSLVAMSEAMEKLRFDGIDIASLAKVAVAKSKKR